MYIDYRQTSEGWLVVQLLFLLYPSSCLPLLILLSTTSVLKGVLSGTQDPSPGLINQTPLESIKSFVWNFDHSHICEIARNRSKWNRPFVPSPDIDLWIITASMYGIEAGFRNIFNLKLRDIGPLDTWSWIRWLLLLGAVGNLLLL